MITASSWGEQGVEVTQTWLGNLMKDLGQFCIWVDNWVVVKIFFF